MRRRPTKRDLLVIVGVLQDAIGQARGDNHDRNPNRFEDVDGTLAAAFDLCVAARSGYPAIEDRLGPWGARLTKRKVTS